MINEISSRFSIDPIKVDLAERLPDPSPTVLAEFVSTPCMPWCQRCRCWQGREIIWSDGSTSLRCRACGATLPEWPAVDESEEGQEAVAENAK